MGSHTKIRLSRAHVWTTIALWIGFTALTFVIAWDGVDGVGADHHRTVVVTTLATPLGPMTGAISRHLQSCCWEFSVSLLPFCLTALALGGALQWVIPPKNRGLRILRVAIWGLGLFVWFGGGIVSFGHALT
jgi:hypothetical protein